jgi:hypothetical protein
MVLDRLLGPALLSPGVGILFGYELINLLLGMKPLLISANQLIANSSDIDDFYFRVSL